jgi:hypothetical protein
MRNSHAETNVTPIGHPEDRPADLGAPRGWFGGVARADQVGLAYRAGDRERVFHDPRAESP